MATTQSQPQESTPAEVRRLSRELLSLRQAAACARITAKDLARQIEELEEAMRGKGIDPSAVAEAQ